MHIERLINLETYKMAMSDNLDWENPINLKTFIPYRMVRISDKLSQSTSARFVSYGVSSPEWRIMAVLAEYGVASSKFLQEHTSMDKSRINRAIGSMVDKKWIIRKLEDNDRRQNKITLTNTGKSIFGKVGKMGQDIQDEWLENFTPAEITQLQHLLDKLEQTIP